MERKETIDRIRSVVAESAANDIDLDAVSEDTGIASLGFDSLAVLDLLFDLEQEFGIEITAVEIQQIATVGELVSYLIERSDVPVSEGG